jgi:predicted nucleic acid-binding protein
VSSKHYVVDSSVWIEILNDAPLARSCLRAVRGAARVGVPTVVIFEVYKKILAAHSDHEALSAIATLSQYEILDLTREVSLSAADISIREKLAMADSIVLAHARAQPATLLTLDNDFAGIEGAQVVRRE